MRAAPDLGDLVLAEKAGRPPRMTVKVSEKLGDPFAPRSFSLIAIHKHGIPNQFAEETIEEAERVAKLPLGEAREDPRVVPIVAIDPADARDHDDAVWADADDDPANVGGFEGNRRNCRCQLLCPPRSAAGQARRASAATASISRIASSPCCPKR